jgi:hypothetical protein
MLSGMPGYGLMKELPMDDVAEPGQILTNTFEKKQKRNSLQTYLLLYYIYLLSAKYLLPV